MSTRAFRSSYLVTVEFKENSLLTCIPKIAFADCQSLETVTLPDSCTTLNESAFEKCQKLKYFNHNLKIIGATAFSGCISLTNFNFSTIQEPDVLNPGCFLNCFNLMSFYVENNSKIKEDNGYIYSTNLEIFYLFPP